MLLIYVCVMVVKIFLIVHSFYLFVCLFYELEKVIYNNCNFSLFRDAKSFVASIIIYSPIGLLFLCTIELIIELFAFRVMKLFIANCY